jgi:hypothetical protein
VPGIERLGRVGRKDHRVYGIVYPNPFHNRTIWNTVYWVYKYITGISIVAPHVKNRMGPMCFGIERNFVRF